MPMPARLAADRNTPLTMWLPVAPTAIRIANSRRRFATSSATRLNKPSIASAKANPANSANTHALNRHGAISLLTTSSSIMMPLTSARGSLLPRLRLDRRRHRQRVALLARLQSHDEARRRADRGLCRRVVHVELHFVQALVAHVADHADTVRHTPFGSRWLALKEAALMRLPTGSCPGKNAAAVLSLISATRGAVARSSSENIRPRSSGMLIAVK